MTDAEYNKAKATMPWTEQVINTGKSCIVQMIDNQGREVPLFTMTAFLALLTGKLTRQVEKEEVKA